MERTPYHAKLQQLGAPTNDDDIDESLAGALERAITEQLMDQQRPAHDPVNLAVAAEGFQHVFGSVNFRVGELLDNGPRFDMFLQRLARSRNSSEAFNSNQGFQVDMAVVRTPDRGGGTRKTNPGRVCLDKENKKKRCIISIRNHDALCCARAIVTMKAHCHRLEGNTENLTYQDLRKGYPIQTTMTKQLHASARMPEGPCGVEELKQFQRTLGSNYQLLVICRSKPFFDIQRTRCSKPNPPPQIRSSL